MKDSSVIEDKIGKYSAITLVKPYICLGHIAFSRAS